MSLREEVSKLLQERAIEPVLKEEGNRGLYLRYFTVPKRDGGLCPILDLRCLNEFATYIKIRSLEHLFPYLYTAKSSGGLEVCDGGFEIPVQSSPVWPVFRLMGLYENDGGSGSTLQN